MAAATLTGKAGGRPSIVGGPNGGRVGDLRVDLDDPADGVLP
jgi:hypothetical protein